MAYIITSKTRNRGNAYKKESYYGDAKSISINARADLARKQEGRTFMDDYEKAMSNVKMR